MKSNEMLNLYLQKNVKQKENLSSQKVELARKPQSILNDVKNLDTKLRSEEGKIDKIYLNYKNAQKEFVNLMDDINSQLDKYEDDLREIMNVAQEIGLDARQIDGFKEAADLILQITKISNQNKKLYPSV
jgi:peptidoglycan hydrolase CwlO-like protein